MKLKPLVSRGQDCQNCQEVNFKPEKVFVEKVDIRNWRFHSSSEAFKQAPRVSHHDIRTPDDVSPSVAPKAGPITRRVYLLKFSNSTTSKANMGGGNKILK